MYKGQPDYNARKQQATIITVAAYFVRIQMFAESVQTMLFDEIAFYDFFYRRRDISVSKQEFLNAVRDIV